MEASYVFSVNRENIVEAENVLDLAVHLDSVH